MRFRWPRFWVDNFHGFNYHLSWQERRRLIIGRVEDAGFDWWIVIVAGVGFLTDAYDIFAVNTVIPMISTVYWGGSFPSRYHFALNASTLLGSMLGQILFGVLADRYGRRKMYGLELVVTIIASLGFAASANGVFGSMSLIAWFIFWRLVMGVGIGADYPLSAVITSEFAPTRYRGRMIAAVFFWQPVGQLLATLLALIATEGFRSHILRGKDAVSFSIHATDAAGVDCAQTVDRVWRLVSGLGAVPAAIAMVFRLTIPESVYWVLDVKNDSNQAMHTRDYWPARSSDAESNDFDSIQLEDHPPEVARSSNEEATQTHSAITISGNPTNGTTLRPVATGLPVDSVNSVSQTPSIIARTNDFEDPHPREQSFSDFVNFFWNEGNWTDLFATSLNWMLLDFTFYLLGVNSSRIVPSMFKGSDPIKRTPLQLLLDNEWHTLVATSIGAILGGALAIKIMNNNSRRVIQMWSSIVLAFLFVVVGALYITVLETAAASIVVVYVLCQFFYNAGPNTTTFIIPAEAFPTRYRCACHGISAAAGKLGSVLGQIVVTKLIDDAVSPSDTACPSNSTSSMNTTCPTNNTLHSNGTSQLDTTSASHTVGPLLISFFVIMVAGAAITKYMTPETCDINGKSRTLEELSQGKKVRGEMERVERQRVRETEREARK